MGFLAACARWRKEISFGGSRNAVAGFMAHRAARNCVFAERRAATPVLLVSPPWSTQSSAFFARIPCATTATREHPYNKETKVEGGADRGPRYQSAYR